MPAHPNPAVEFVPGDRRDLLLLCDHASNHIPAHEHGLGLAAAEREAHIAWDIGAAGLARVLAARLDCPLFLGGGSRLLADLNRAPDSPELILDESEGIPVPGNRGLSTARRERRLADWHQPYHHAVGRYLHSQLREGLRPALLAVHSFTPVYHGRTRPWPVGLLWKQPEPWLDTLFAALRAEGLEVGDNQPYDGSIMLGHTLETHAIAHGLRHLLVEVRNDQIAEAAGQAAWAARLHRALAAARFVPLLAAPDAAPHAAPGAEAACSP